MRGYFVTEALLDDSVFDLGGMIRQMLEESPDSTIQLTLMGFNERLGPVPKWLADTEPRGEVKVMTEGYDRLRVELSIEVDRELVEAERNRALEEDPDLTNFYGRPWEWGPATSLLDVFDAQSSGVIVRSEVIRVDKAPPPYQAEASSFWRRLLAKLGIGS